MVLLAISVYLQLGIDNYLLTIISRYLEDIFYFFGSLNDIVKG